MYQSLKPMELSRTPSKIELETYLRSLDARDIYQNSVIQRKGLTVEGIPVTETIAEILLYEDLLYPIQTITRKSSYCSGHVKEMELPCSNRKEEILAIKIFKNCDFAVDYQVPLKNKRSDSAGKIDLLLHENDTLILGELKGEGSVESLLRAVLEVETYWRTLDRRKLLTDYAKHGIHAKTILKAIMIFRDSRQFKEICDPKFSLTQLLMKRYDIRIILVDILEGCNQITYYK